MGEDSDGKVLELFAPRLHEPRRQRARPSVPQPQAPQPHLPLPHAPLLREPLWRELVGQVLRSERVETGRTLQQISQRAGVSPQYLSEVERGRKDPSSEMLESICGALGLRLSDLLVAAGRTLLTTTLAPSSPTTRPSGVTSMAA